MKKVLFLLAALMVVSVGALQVFSDDKAGNPEAMHASSVLLPGPRLDSLPGPAALAPPDLRDQVDPALAETLARKLRQRPAWRTLIRQHKMAVSLVDMRDSLRPRLAAVNGDDMMYAASLPKIALLLAAMDAAERGDLDLTPTVREDLRVMISKSSNQAASRMIDRLGYEQISRVLTHPEYLLYDEDHGGGLWVGKHYGRQGGRRPDPLQGLSHAATTNQVARFYYLLAHGRLVSPGRSQEMLQLMEGPELTHKFVNTLNKVSPGARIYRKSGSWRHYHADSALVRDDEGRHYILVALIDDPEGEQICRQLVHVAEELLQHS